MVSSKEKELFFNRQIRRFCPWLNIDLSILFCGEHTDMIM